MDGVTSGCIKQKILRPMKDWLIKLFIALFVFLCLSFFMPVLLTGVEQWPEWLRSPHFQFLFNLIVAVIFGFNPGTAFLINNSLTISGNGNYVKQGTRSAARGPATMNSTKIKGNKNKVDQG